MRVVPPLEISDARLLACNVAEPSPGEQIYSASTSYADGARVISTATHRTYESLIAGNLGNALTDSSKWADVGPSNRYAMFDHYRGTVSKRDGGISMTIKPGVRIDTIALIDMSAVSAEIIVRAGTPQAVVYSRTTPLATRSVSSWSEYFFTSFAQQSELFRLDIPPFSDAEITINLTGSGTISIGSVILGMSVWLGETQLNATDDVLNFSKIERDEFGDVMLIPRRSIPTTDLTVWTEKANVPRIRQLRDDLNARPALWAGIDEVSDEYFDALLRLGIYKRFSINLAHHKTAVIDLTIEDM